MRLLVRSLIAAVLIFAAANSARAECPVVSPDSTISFAFYLGDTLANPVARATGDSMWIFTYYPSGGLAFADSVRLLNGANLTYRQTQIQGRLTAHFSYSRLISAIDGTAQNGPYEVVIIASDSSLALQSTFIYCFDERLGGLDSIGIDNSQFWASANAARLKEILDTLQVYDNAGQFQAEVAAILDSINLYDDATRSWGANILKVGGDAITDNGDGRLEVNVEEWRDIAPLALTTDGSIIADLDSTTSAGGAGSVNAIELAELTSDSVWEAKQAEGTAGLGSMGELLSDAANPGYPTAANIATQVWSNATRTLTSGAYGSMADSVWKKGVVQTSFGDADSTFADAFVNTSGQIHVWANLDTATGTIANSQVDDDVNVNVLTASTNSIEDQDVATLTVDTTGQGTQIWSHGTRTLTTLSGIGVDVTSISGSTAVADNLEEMLDNDSIIGPRVEIRALEIDPSANTGTASVGLSIKNDGTKPVVHLAASDTGHGLLITTSHVAAGAGSTIVLRPETPGNAIWIHGDSNGTGIANYPRFSTGTTWQPVYLEGGASLSSASGVLEVISNGAAPALAIGGGTSNAVEIYGNGNGDGINISGSGSGHGVNSTGGATGHGMHLQGGATSGSGLHLRRTGSATGMHDLALFNNDADSGFAKADTGIIRLAVYNMLLDQSHNFDVQIVNAEFDSMATVVADTVWATDTNNVLWNGLPTKFGYWNASRQAATATIDCDGNGLVICTLDVRNAAGGLGGVTVTINNTSNVFQYQAMSNANGFVYFNLDQSTTYRVVAGGLAGSVHDSLPYQTLVTTTATNKRDTVPMTTSAITAPSAANLTRIYTYEDDGAGGRLAGVKLHAVLLLPSDSMSATKIAFDTSTGVAYGANTEVVDTGMVTNVNGYAHIDLTRNDYISPFGSRWQVWAEYKKQVRWSVILNVTSSSSQCIQAVLGVGSCP